MLILGAYLLLVLIALSWVALDNNATAAFEILNSCLHRTARDMGMYWKWLLQSLLRAALLITLVVTGVVAAAWILQQNPWGLGWLGKASLFAVMLTCSLALFALPHLSAYLRLKRFLSFKAAELVKLVSIVSSEEGVRQHLVQADLGVFGGVDGWTAWHPREEGWNEEPFWSGLDPVVYLHQDAEVSFIVPVHMASSYFLAWNLPSGSVTPGNLMPISPRCATKAVSDLRGRKGWSVVHAEFDVDSFIDGAAA